jgi:hypothetical protein
MSGGRNVLVATFPADEILVAISGDESIVDAIEADDTTGGRTIDGVPVRAARLR